MANFYARGLPTAPRDFPQRLGNPARSLFDFGRCYTLPCWHLHCSQVLREFLQVFDGYSIGSNDLTQLVLGLDRDSGTVAHLFDERNPAVKQMIAQAITAARQAGKPIGICGQAPSDYPEFATWLVEQGIHSISLNPDTVIKTTLLIAQAEQQKPKAAARDAVI